MKALVWNGTRELAFEDLPEPEPAAGEVVLDVELAGSAAPTCTATAGTPGRGCRRSCSGTRSSGRSAAPTTRSIR